MPPQTSAGQRRFGMVAHTRLPLAKGAWEFSTLSDDGVRVTVDGKPVIENWAWHGPTRNTGQLTLEANAPGLFLGQLIPLRYGSGRREAEHVAAPRTRPDRELDGVAVGWERIPQE